MTPEVDFLTSSLTLRGFLIVTVYITLFVNEGFCGGPPKGPPYITGQMELALDKEQQRELEKFKRKASSINRPEYMKTDIIMVKYLRAKNFDANAAVQQLTENQKFREEYDLNDFNKEEYNKLTKTFPTKTFKDKKGQQVTAIVLNKFDMLAISMDEALSKKFKKQLFSNLEQMYQKQIRNFIAGKTDSAKSWYAFDLHGADAMKQLCPPCIALMKSIAPDLETRWPGVLQMIVIINLPGMMNGLLDSAKMMFSKEVQALIVNFDEDVATWKTFLDKYLKPKQYDVAGFWMGDDPNANNGFLLGIGGSAPAPPPPAEEENND